MTERLPDLEESACPCSTKMDCPVPPSFTHSPAPYTTCTPFPPSEHIGRVPRGLRIALPKWRSLPTLPSFARRWQSSRRLKLLAEWELGHGKSEFATLPRPLK